MMIALLAARPGGDGMCGMLSLTVPFPAMVEVRHFLRSSCVAATTFGFTAVCSPSDRPFELRVDDCLVDAVFSVCIASREFNLDETSVVRSEQQGYYPETDDNIIRKCRWDLVVRIRGSNRSIWRGTTALPSL